MKSSVKERLLEILKSFEGDYIPQSYLHRVVKASKSRISEVLRELEREGLILRTTVGRSKIIYVHPGFSEHQPSLIRKQLKLGIVYSSEYLFLGYFVKELSRHNIRVNVVVTKDGLSTTKAVAEGVLDLAFSPLVGQLYLYPVYRTYKIVQGGLQGGFRVLHKPGKNVVYSSMISTMDYVRHYVLKRGLIDAEKTVYFDDSSKVYDIVKNGGYVVAWHPIYLHLKELGFREVITPQDLDIDFCCTLAISRTVNDRYYRLIKKAYAKAIESYRKNPEKFIEYYSMVTGISVSTLKNAVKEYKVSSEINKKTYERVINVYSLNVPSSEVYIESLNEYS